MSALTDIGNGVGNIIVTKPDGITIVTSFPNNHRGQRQAISHALKSGTLIGNRAAHGTITIDDLTGMAAESVTAININAVDQLGGVSVTVGAHTLTSFAAALAAGINSFTAVSPDYTATAVGNVVNVTAPASSGSTVNGESIGVAKSNPGILTTQTNIDNGSEADTVYDKVIGYRYLLNSDSNDPEAIGGAVDISKNIIMRGMQTTLDTQTIVVASSATALSFERTMVIMNILLSSGAPETIDTIDTSDFSIGDQILLSNASGGLAVTFNETGNIVLANNSDFISGDPELVLALKLTDVSGTLKWTEIYRAPNIEISVEAMRNALIPEPILGVTQVTMTGGSQSLTLLAGIDPGYIVVIGSPTLTGSFTIVTPGGTPLPSEVFIIDYKATPNLSGGSVTIFGRPLLVNEIEGGSLRFEARYNSNGPDWRITKLQDTDGGGWIDTSDLDDKVVTDLKLANDAAIDANRAVGTNHIKDTAVTKQKIASNAVSPDKADSVVKGKMVHTVVSYETGFLGPNEFRMKNKGEFVGIQYSIRKNIEATDDATNVIFNVTQAVTIETVGAISGGTIQGVLNVTGVAANPTYNAGDIIRITTAKTTPGGEATIIMEYEDRE